MKKYAVRIRGVRPLLVNRFPMEGNILGKRKKASVTDPDEATKKCLYIKDDLIYLPAEHFEGALIKGAVQIIFKGKKTFKDIVASSILVMPREIPFLVPKDPSKYAVDIMTAVIPSTRGRVVVYRPRWDKWEFEFEIHNSADDDLATSTLKDIISEAGKIGVGTYRLKYGKFELVSIEEIK